MLLRLEEASKQLGISIHTLRGWLREGVVKSHKTIGGHYRIPQDEINRLLGKKKGKKREQNKVILYARVSNSQNKNNLDSQAKRLYEYAIAKGYKVEKQIKEIGSGINDNRAQLLWVLNQVKKRGNIGKIVVEHKDRLTRFGFNYLEKYCEAFDVAIEVINIDEDKENDLMADFVAIITSFCARLYGIRRSKRKTEKIIQTLKEEPEIA